MKWNSGKHLAGSYSLSKCASAMDEQPSVMSLYDTLRTAKKGEPWPKFRRSAVNLLLIDREDRELWRGGLELGESSSRHFY